MTKNWQIKKLSEVFSIRPSKNEAIKKLRNNDLISFVPMEDLGVFTKDLIPSQERKLIDVAGSYTYFGENDVLLAKITPCFENGKLGIARNLTNMTGFGSSEYIVFRSMGEVIPEYLFYVLASDDFREPGKKRMTGSSGHKRLAKEYVENYIITYPDVSEQHRVVKILDESFAAISKAKENTEKNIENSKELFKSYLNSVFNNQNIHWMQNTLYELTTKIGSGATPKGGKESYQDNGISLIRSLNVYDNEFRIKNLAYINDRQADLLSIVIVQKNDVLINITGASVARCFIVPDEILPARVNQHVSIIRVKKELIIPEFLHYLLTSKVYKDKLLDVGSKGGSTRQAITKKQLEDFLISYPSSLSEQNEIVSKLDELSLETKKIEENYKQKLALLDELKKSLLHQAFTGQL